MTALQGRIVSIDILRGLVIALMALDHARDYFAPTPFDPVDLSQSSSGWFITRWITHLCAPVFVFLAGTSAFLRGRKYSRKDMSVYLLTRGLMLVILELTWNSFVWQFGYSVMVMQVLWALGWSMVVLAALIWLPRWLIAAFALITIAGHNLLDPVEAVHLGDWSFAWMIAHEPGFRPGGIAQGIYVGYPLIPWLGVMAAGYLFGELLLEPGQVRERGYLVIGFSLMALFVLLRSGNFYGDPLPWSEQVRGGLFSFWSFINTQKYPPSLLYLCMTLGPSMLLLWMFEKWPVKPLHRLLPFGREPLFFYLLHVPVIHALSIGFHLLVSGGVVNFFSGPQTWPETYQASLPVAYAAWLVVLVIMYFLCLWYAGFKKSRRRHRSPAPVKV